MRTLFLLLLLFVSFTLRSQTPTNARTHKTESIDDKHIVGVIKIYANKDIMEVEVVYHDTTYFELPLLVFDIVARAYLLNFPIYNHEQFFDIYTNNLDRYHKFYQPKRGDE